MQVCFNKMFRPFFTVALFTVAHFAAVAQSTGSAVTFQEFIAQFPKASLPYTMTEQSLHAELAQGGSPMKSRLDVRYFDFLPTLADMASRDNTPVSAQPIAAFETETHFAVLFNTGRKFARQFKTYHLTVFDKQGNYVASRCIGGVNSTNMAAFDIDTDLLVTVRTYRLDWLKNVHTQGIQENTLVDTYPLPNRQFSAAAAKQTGEDWEYRPIVPAAANGLTASVEK
jgi:hypothetical protein